MDSESANGADSPANPENQNLANPANPSNPANPVFISVKLTPIGRSQSFVVASTNGPRLNAGGSVVVQTDGGPAVGTVVRSIPQTVERRAPSHDSSDRSCRGYS